MVFEEADDRMRPRGKRDFAIRHAPPFLIPGEAVACHPPWWEEAFPDFNRENTLLLFFSEGV